VGSNIAKKRGAVKMAGYKEGPAFGLSVLQKLASDGDPEAVKRYEKAVAEYHKDCHMRVKI